MLNPNQCWPKATLWGRLLLRERLGWCKACSRSAPSSLFSPAQKPVISPFLTVQLGHQNRTTAIREDEAGGVLCGSPHAMPAQGKGPRALCTPGRPPLGPPVSPQRPASAGPGRRPAPPQMEAGLGPGRPRVPLVYLNSFGSHRCGSIIRYGRGCPQAEVGPAGPPLSRPSPVGEAGGPRAAPAPGDEADPGPAATSGRARAVGSCGVAKPVGRHRGTCGPGRGPLCPWEWETTGPSPRHVPLFGQGGLSLRRVSY